MFVVNTELANDTGTRDGDMVRCPVCGQKLFEVRDNERYANIRIHCRRCKRYIDVYILGKYRENIAE